MIVDSRPLTGKQVVHRIITDLSTPPATSERRRGQRHGTTPAGPTSPTGRARGPNHERQEVVERADRAEITLTLTGVV